MGTLIYNTTTIIMGDRHLAQLREQVLHLGQAQWPWPNQPPGSLVFSFDPDTGVGHEDSYKAPEDFA